MSDMDMLAALRAVLDLHEPDSMGELQPLCGFCGPVFYPCPTVRAITTALKEANHEKK